MLIDSLKLGEKTVVEGSIAIIGGGAAGITLAVELARHFNDVILLESGGLEFDSATQNLNIGTILGHATAPLDASRLRFLGGTTNHWHGQSAPLDPIDFQSLEGRPYSGWPMTLDELKPFYERAYRYCEIGNYRETSSLEARATPAMQDIVRNPDFAFTEFRHSPPTRFGERYRKELQDSQRVSVYLNATVSDILVSDGGRSISSLEVRTLSGARLEVRAPVFILSTGGIENARILLNCTRFFQNGLGNSHDLVGRFFMDHLEVNGTTIIPSRNFDFRALQYQLEGATRVSPALKNSEAIVRKPDRRGCSLIMELEYELPEHVERAQTSPAFRAFQAIVRNARHGNLPSGLGQQECDAVNGVGPIATVLWNRVSNRIFDTNLVKAIAVRLEGEQEPNPDSRVVLIEERDALGLRRAGLDWRISAADRNSLYETAVQFARGIGSAGFGRVVIPFEANDDQSMIHTAHHHMGTTRMHDDPRRGVVDRNCRVHELANLYIAGSSVFPTGGRVNPTVTIVALAIRLADHLKSRHERS